jgi:hypothetical protein
MPRLAEENARCPGRRMPLIDERETADEAMIRIQEQKLLEKEIALCSSGNARR